VDDLHEAFANRQSAGTRLVTTQATYLMAEWMSVIAPRADVWWTATAHRAAIERDAPELLSGSGAFASISVDAAAGGAGEQPVGREAAANAPPSAATALLVEAFRQADPAARLAACVRALDLDRTPGGLVATASACMEVNDWESAARDLDEAIDRAPSWAAAHFERGKLSLRVDDMEAASHSFRRAATLLPTFGAAWSNLGATLGELDRPDEALEALDRALRADPTSPQTLNNRGVLQRETGDLRASEATFREVIVLTPDLAFGHYNLGHTLFLQGRYQAALAAYGEGQRRDPERNPVQASRLALCRLACRDARGALDDLRRVLEPLPKDFKRQLVADTQGVVWALLTQAPDIADWNLVHEWLAAEQAKLR
jgi:tetratricopeptide (TPR) repeat protein